MYDKKEKLGVEVRGEKERKENKPFIFYRGFEERKKEKVN